MHACIRLHAHTLTRAYIAYIRYICLHNDAGLGYASHARVIGGLEEKVLALQTELTAAYRLKAENAQAMLRMKAQAESDEKEVQCAIYTHV